MFGSLFDSHETEGYCPLRALPTREGVLTKAPVGHAGEAGSLKKNTSRFQICVQCYTTAYMCILIPKQIAAKDKISIRLGTWYIKLQ